MSETMDLLARFSLNWAESLAEAVRSIGGRALHQPGVVATDVGRPAGLMNSVVLLAPLQESTVPSLMTSVDAFFAADPAVNARTVFLFSVWPVPDLSAYGWVFVEQMPLMVRQPATVVPPAPPDLQISQVSNLADLHHFEHVMIDGFPVPELAGQPPGSVFGASVLEDPRFAFWLGWHDGHPVTASAAFVAHGLVDLIFLATLPQARGRGFGSALAWTATLIRPDLPALLIASQDGQKLYARLGYQHLCDMPLWIRERP